MDLRVLLLGDLRLAVLRHTVAWDIGHWVDAMVDQLYLVLLLGLPLHHLRNHVSRVGIDCADLGLHSESLTHWIAVDM